MTKTAEADAACMRMKKGNRTSLFGICCNVFLAASKILIGLLSGMISIVADGINNLSDAAASIVSLIGFRLAARPADDEHPHGHARYEYISGLIVSFLVLMAGFELLKSSLEKIFNPTESSFTWITFAILVLSIIVKITMAVVYTKVGKEIASNTILAAAQDSRNDCIATAAVLIAAVIMYFTKLRLDGYMGVGVALFVMYGGFELVRDMISPLLGTLPDQSVIRHIEEKVNSYDGVLGSHDLMMHDYGPGRCYASIHVEVPGNQSVYECHKLIDRIEREFLADDNIHLLIHYDPVMPQQENESAEEELKQYFLSKAENTGMHISIHDLKIADARHVFFDCRIPHEEVEMESRIVEFLMEQSKAHKPPYQAAITIDHGIVSME